ncbi:MAG: tetratricopeptide repeat protein, partial [Cyclobacteriaceae bacterium]|nr:tetratricopeptide repeat protein [Cyclobacteriaceae bacterium]
PYEEDYVISLAEYLIALDREKEAIAFLDSAINKNPTNSRASLLAGEAMRKNGNLPRAQEMLSIAFEDENINVDAKVRLVAQYRNYLPDENLEGLIVRLCDILIRVHSSEANVYAVYGDLLNEMNKKGPARDQYYQSVRLDDSNFAVWQNILLIETQLSEFDSVIVHSEQAMEIFPNQGIVYYLNGYAYLRKAKHQEAITSLEYGKRISTSNLKIINDFNSLLGEAYNGVKDYEKSDSAYDASLDYDPNNYIVLNNYSYYLALRNENMDKAEKMSARLVKENPQDATFLDTYAWVLYTRAKFKEAKKIIERALDSGKAKAIHFEHYGDILYKLGDIDGAVEQWQNAKGMDSTLRLIDKKIADKKLYEN